MITVRPAAPDEYTRIGELTLAAYRALPVDHLWGGYADEILDAETRSEHGELLVAMLDGRLVGSVMYVTDEASRWREWTEPGEVQFRLLAVDPEARGHGAGRALAQACVDRAATGGLAILIHTTPWMRSAQRIYDQLGFVRRPDRDVPYESWKDDRELELPPEWIGQPFLAYRWSQLR